jgi:hypothetical protein
MTDRQPDRPLEESDEVAWAVDDEAPVAALAEQGAPDADTPTFRAPGEPAPERAAAGDVVGDPYGGGAGSAEGFRTGAEQPWEPEDLALAQGHDPTPEHVERARHELEQDGPAAIERTVP